MIASTSFGIEVNSFKNPSNEFQNIARKASDFSSFITRLKLMGFILFPIITKLFKVKLFDSEVDQFFKETVHSLMKYREENGIVRQDILNLLMEAKNGNLINSKEIKDEKIIDGFATVQESKIEASNINWSDQEIEAQAFTFFFGGFDTVSTTMGFLAYELMANPDVQDKLYEEIHEVEEKLDGKLISYEQIQGMKYLDQCVSETLRKWPPALVRLSLLSLKLSF